MKIIVPGRIQNERSSDRAIGLIAAAAAHVLLFVAITFVFQWNTQPETFYAELWSPEDITSNQHGDAPIENKQVPTEPSEELQKPAPAPTPTPQPQQQVQQVTQQLASQAAARAAEEQRQADIALEQQKKKEEELKKQLEEQRQEEEQKRIAEQKRIEQQKKLEEQQRLEAQKKKEEQERLAQQQKLEQERLAEQQRLEEQKKLEEQKRQEEEKQRQIAAQKAAQEKKEKEQQARIAKEMRQAELARILGATKTGSQVGSTQGMKGITRQNLSGSKSAAYVARVIACIRPRINFNVPTGLRRGQYTAVYSVDLTPQGDKIATRKLKASGLPGYDLAVETAMSQCDPFPGPVDNQPIPRQVQITFDPVDIK